MKSSLRVVLLLAMLCPAVSPQADNTVEKRYRLPQRGYLQMYVPAAWDDELRQPPSALPPTIEFRARQGKPFAVLVTPMSRLRADVPPSTKDSIRRSVQQAAEAVKDQAIEKNIELIEFLGAAGPGFYFSVTDPAPKPDEYRFMTQGMLKVSDLVVTFTILTNDGQAQVTRDALTAIKTAIHIASRRREEQAPAPDEQEPAPALPAVPQGTKI